MIISYEIEYMREFRSRMYENEVKKPLEFSESQVVGDFRLSVGEDSYTGDYAIHVDYANQILARKKKKDSDEPEEWDPYIQLNKNDDDAKRIYAEALNAATESESTYSLYKKIKPLVDALREPEESSGYSESKEVDGFQLAVGKDGFTGNYSIHIEYADKGVARAIKSDSDEPQQWDPLIQLNTNEEDAKRVFAEALKAASESESAYSLYKKIKPLADALQE